MQSAYDLYEVNKNWDEYALYVRIEESPHKFIEIRNSGVGFLARVIETDTGFKYPWNMVEDFMIKEFKPFFKLKQAPLPSLRYDIMSYFK